MIGELVEVSPGWKKWLILLGLPHLVLSIANTALWSFSNGIKDQTAFFLLLSFGFGALFTVFLVLIALNRESRIQISALTRYVIPVLTLAPILIFLGRENWLSTAGFMLVCSTIVFADFLNWILFCELAHENPKQRTKIIGWGRFFIHFGMLIGCAIGRLVMGFLQPSASVDVWIWMLCLTVVTMTALSLFVNLVEEHRINVILRRLSRQSPYMAKLDATLQPFFRDTYGLTPREFEVLVFLHEGLSASQIQAQLFLSLNTVNTHTKRIYRKLDVHSKVELYNQIEKIILSVRHP
jgi:DNA-binding CsgD family transcriptional regulator